MLTASVLAEDKANAPLVAGAVYWQLNGVGFPAAVSENVFFPTMSFGLDGAHSQAAGAKPSIFVVGAQPGVLGLSLQAGLQLAGGSTPMEAAEAQGSVGPPQEELEHVLMIVELMIEPGLLSAWQHWFTQFRVTVDPPLAMILIVFVHPSPVVLGG